MKLQLIKLISLGLTREEAIEFIKTSILDFVDDYNLISIDIVRSSVDSYIAQELFEK